MIKDVDVPFTSWKIKRKELTLHTELAECNAQSNGNDCGVFVLMHAFCIVFGLKITTYSQKECEFFREHICNSVLAGEVRLNYMLRYYTVDPDKVVASKS